MVLTMGYEAAKLVCHSTSSLLVTLSNLPNTVCIRVFGATRVINCYKQDDYSHHQLSVGEPLPVTHCDIYILLL